ncbi:MAG: oxidoreductase [Betaproteobacteria bacterium RIFCSPLOWO2_02_FULL_65_24]|nr:MAG: oxidoreductase [Betaproteobacteria bacterium RIFCSPLOWO2_02_FULL_65_24]OGA96837.1 MAG: oxidoreductase [Betaproteobacteria bacterium RIFCSPLOWO2_12_FULL_66_14]
MKKWNLVFDVALCTGCRNCEMAVKDEYVGNSFPGYSAQMPLHGHRWVQIRQRERGRFPAVDVAYLFQSCQHCDDPACLRAATNGAVTKRSDGIVQIHPERARGQKAIVDACPFGAVYWNEELALPQHWNFDAHLLDAGWAEPRPVQACPTGALRALKVEDDEMKGIVRKEKLERFGPGAKVGTRVHYRNLALYTHAFVAGTLLTLRGGLEECVAGACVKLLRGNEALGQAASDAFGDFRFDGLPPNERDLRIEVTAAGYRQQRLEVEPGESRWLGEIRLEPS